MERYLFRGLRTDGGGWVYGDLINLHNGRKFIVYNKFGACIDDKGNFLNTEAPFVNEVIPETVGQKHNKLSKCEVNGKEVFVGDELIINWYDGRNAPRKGNHTLMTIEYWSNEILSCEVIGNIHQEANNA